MFDDYLSINHIKVLRKNHIKVEQIHLKVVLINICISQVC